MNDRKYIVLLILAVAVLIPSVAVIPEELVAFIVVAIFSSAVYFAISKYFEESVFLQKIFIFGVLLRVGFGVLIHFFELREFFGGDANYYDQMGNRIMEVWFGYKSAEDAFSQEALRIGGPGWGLNYFAAIIYSVIGRNILAAQFVCATIGAVTPVMVFECARKIFDNKQVAKKAALLVAIFPAMVLWSAQLSKDGLIIFFLLVIMTMILKLQESIKAPYLVAVIFSLIGILSLRFYIFFMVVVAIVGSFVIGSADTRQSIITRIVLVAAIGLGLTYLGASNTANQDFEKYANLERLQNAREGLAKVGDSGYGQDLDVSTTSGAISVLPVGFVYLMFAPFPWESGNFRQTITLPEVLIWWSLMPLMISGIIFTLRHKLRNSVAIILFTVLLTLSYSLLQGNVGTAYRQRTQIQVFLFMFIAVGWELRMEKKQNRQMERILRQQTFKIKKG
jgi:hypothetical protein